MSNKIYYEKVLSRSSLGLTGMHDIYWPVPQKVNPESFYGNLEPGGPRKRIIHIDRSSGDEYKFYSAKQKNGEYRLYRVKQYLLEDNNAKPQDKIHVEKKISNGKVQYIVDINRNGVSINNNDQAKKKRADAKRDAIKKAEDKVKKKVKKFRAKVEKSYNPFSRAARSGQTRKAGDLVPKAEIYLVRFNIEGKIYLYVGQDSHCAGTESYFGSSLIMFHYETIFGKKIFTKKILETTENIKQRDLNSLERKYIEQYMLEANEIGGFSLNYTGKGKIYS